MRSPGGRRSGPVRTALAWSVALGLSSAAAADEIDTVNLGASGPDRDLPVGKSFYVAGTAAATTQAVQAIVVRKGSPWVARGAGPSCSELRKEMGAFRAVQPATAPAAPAPAAPAPAAPAPAAPTGDGADPFLDAGFTPLDPGRRSAGSIWEHGQGAALITSAWRRGELKGPQPFKLLVPGDGELFRAGYSYCLFVFTQDRVTTSVEDKVREAFDTQLDAFRRCTPGDQACEQKATDALVVALRATGAKGLNRLVNPANVMRTAPAALRHMLESWRAATDPTAPAQISFLRRVDLDPFIPLGDATPDARLADYIAHLLARRDGLFALSATRKPLTYRTVDGKTEINHLGLRDDGKLDGSADATPAHTVPLSLKLDELPIANTSVTARDLIEATQGRIRLSKYLSLKAAEAELAGPLAADYGAPEDKLKPLIDLRDRVEGLAEAVRRALAASEGFRCEPRSYPRTPAPPATAEQKLGEWLRCRPVLLEDCSGLAAGWGKHVAVPPTCAKAGAAAAKAWPGYAEVGGHPLDKIAVTAADLVDSHKAWREARATLVRESSKTTEVSSEARIGFTQETWVGSYLTPNLGYAHIPFADATLFYASIQLHLVPNPIDDPQWSHRGWYDWVRAVAFEFGFAPTAGSFGRDGRLDGPWNLPPLFFGIGFHPIPYTSITGGFTLDDLRTTTLTGQVRHLDSFGFVAFSLQANLPDLLYKKLGYGLKTTGGK